jgi:hypothetical protein
LALAGELIVVRANPPTRNQNRNRTESFLYTLLSLLSPVLSLVFQEEQQHPETLSIQSHAITTVTVTDCFLHKSLSLTEKKYYALLFYLLSPEPTKVSMYL